MACMRTQSAEGKKGNPIEGMFTFQNLRKLNSGMLRIHYEIQNYEL